MSQQPMKTVFSNSPHAWCYGADISVYMQRLRCPKTFYLALSDKKVVWNYNVVGPYGNKDRPIDAATLYPLFSLQALQ